jgi:RecA/RadA recombinase
VAVGGCGRLWAAMLTSLPQPVREALAEAGISSPAVLLNHIKIGPPAAPPRSAATDEHAPTAANTAANTAATTFTPARPTPAISCSDALLSVISDSVVEQTVLSRAGILTLLSHFVHGLTARVVMSAAAMPCLNDMRGDHVSTGCPVLDGLLGRGFRRGEVVEICGKSGSGKTQLAMSTLATLLRGRDTTATAIMIDTAHGFCPFRCAELLQYDAHRHGGHGGGNSIQTVAAGAAALAGAEVSISGGESEFMDDRMARLSILSVYSIYDLYAALENIADSIGANAAACAAMPSLLVIDCIATFVAPNLCKGYSAQASIEALGKMLRQIARDFRVAVVVTNNAVANRGTRSEEWKPALGKAWNFVPDRRLQLYTMPTSRDHAQPLQSTAHTLRCRMRVGPGGVRCQLD